MVKQKADEAAGGYIPIPCGDYEMLELACMDGCDVEVHTDGRTIVGRADTLNVCAGEEFLVIQLADGACDTIRVDRIRCLVIHTRPARFEAHTFACSDESPVR